MRPAALVLLLAMTPAFAVAQTCNDEVGARARRRLCRPVHRGLPRHAAALQCGEQLRADPERDRARLRPDRRGSAGRRARFLRRIHPVPSDRLARMPQRIGALAYLVRDYDEAIAYFTRSARLRADRGHAARRRQALGAGRAARLGRHEPAAGEGGRAGSGRAHRRPGRRPRLPLPPHRRFRPRLRNDALARRALPGSSRGTRPTARSPSSPTSTATSGTCFS